MPYYTGIGSRRTPADILSLMEKMAWIFRRDAFVLRSGHAAGADQAFERGAQGKAEIYLPWPGFNKLTPVMGRAFGSPSSLAKSQAAKYHPGWQHLSWAGKALHARNVHQVLGYGLGRPSSYVICWTPGGRGEGGTGQAIRVARDNEIPVWDMGNPEHLKIAHDFVVDRL